MHSKKRDMHLSLLQQAIQWTLAHHTTHPTEAQELAASDPNTPTGLRICLPLPQWSAESVRK